MARSRPRYNDPSADTRDINRANRFQREDDRRRRDATAVAAGGRKGMSRFDQDALAANALGSSQPSALSQTASDALVPRMRTPNPVAQADASRAVAGSSVPTGNQNERNVAGAIAASPVAYQPTAGKLNLPDQRITSGGAGAVDAALQKNIALTQPGGGRGLLSPVAPTERPAAPMVAQTSPGIGKVLPDAVGDALFGDRPVAGQTNYGTASVRQASPGEKLAPATITDNGVQRDGPVDRVAMDNQLRTQHPELFVAGSPKNQAFLDHAKRYGVDDAYRNADSLLATVKSPDAAIAGASPNREAGVAPDPERVAQLDKSIADSQPGIVSRVAGGAYRGLQRIGEAVTGAPKAIADAARNILPSSPGATAGQTPVTRGGAQPFKMIPRTGPQSPVAADTGGTGGALAGTGKALIGAGTAKYTPPSRVAQRPPAVSDGGSFGNALRTASTLSPGPNAEPPDVVRDNEEQRKRRLSPVAF